MTFDCYRRSRLIIRYATRRTQMNSLSFRHHATELLIIVVFSALTSLSCTNMFFVAVVQPTETKVIEQNKIKVYIDLSGKSLLKNRIAIVNKSDKTISVHPIDVVLRIIHAGVTLPAVSDYREYVHMRYGEAIKKCSDAEYPSSCSDAIDKEFKRYHKVKPFDFGDNYGKNRQHDTQQQTGYYTGDEELGD